MLLNIPNFIITKSVVPDYMHGVQLGVIKTLLFLWFEAAEHRVYYQEYITKNTQLTTLHTRLDTTLFFNL